MQPASNNACISAASSLALLDADNHNTLSGPQPPREDGPLGQTLSSSATKKTSLMVQPTEPDAGITIDDEATAELLMNSIVSLYQEHERLTNHANKTKGKANERRVQLGAKLFELKVVYSKRGRGGRWAGLLSELGIPRATADRYVREHEKRMAPRRSNVLSEAFSGPTPEAVSAFVKKNAPKLKAVLTTTVAVEQFLAELTIALRST